MDYWVVFSWILLKFEQLENADPANVLWNNLGQLWHYYLRPCVTLPLG